jgi:NAD(P)-dependent dehydrogenase (short-subunit alcohol dehydrogenase family)
LALAFAREGAIVVICARHAKNLHHVEKELQAQGAEVLAITADVRNKRDVERLVSTTLLEYKRIDVLVNNASILGPTPLPYLIDTPTEAFEDVLRVNIVGPFMLTKTVLPSMVECDQGSIINVISDAGIEIYEGWGAYGTSKAALEHMTRVWAAELKETGVRVNSVDPGEMDTEMHALAMPEEDPLQYPKPEELVKVFLYLASDESKDISGQRFFAQEFSR